MTIKEIQIEINPVYRKLYPHMKLPSDDTIGRMVNKLGRSD